MGMKPQRALVSDFIDFKIGATEKLRRQLLDGETDGIGCAYKSFVPKWLAPGVLALRREQFSLRAVIEQLGLGCMIKGVHLFQKAHRVGSAGSDCICKPPRPPR